MKIECNSRREQQTDATLLARPSPLQLVCRVLALVPACLVGLDREASEQYQVRERGEFRLRGPSVVSVMEGYHIADTCQQRGVGNVKRRVELVILEEEEEGISYVLRKRERKIERCKEEEKTRKEEINK